MSSKSNFLKSQFDFINKISKESKLAFAVLIFSFIIIWFFNIGEYKTYTFNYSICLSLAGIVGCLMSFFYSFAQISSDMKAKNWFTIGLDTLLNLFQLVFFISGVKELTQRADPFNTSIFILFAFVIFFAQIYINKSYRLFKATIISTLTIGLITGIFKLLEIYTPSDYLSLLWALGSYAILGVTLVMFFATLKVSINNLTKMN
jgi:hypothetical protein